MWKIVDSSMSHGMPFTSGMGAATPEGLRGLAAMTGGGVWGGAAAAVAATLALAACVERDWPEVSSKTAAAPITSTKRPTSTMAVGKGGAALGAATTVGASRLERRTPVRVRGGAIPVSVGS